LLLCADCLCSIGTLNVCKRCVDQLKCIALLPGEVEVDRNYVLRRLVVVVIVSVLYHVKDDMIHLLTIGVVHVLTLGRRSFAVAGPMTWHSLSADLRDPTCSDESFRRTLKTFLFAKY